MRSRNLLVLGAFALLASSPARGESSGTVVRGVVLRAAASAPTAGPARYRVHKSTEPSEPVPDAGCNCDPGRFAVVQLTGDHLPKIKLPVQPPVMAQKDRMFVPSVLVVPVGGKVGFPNMDPFFHNVFSYSKSARFDLGRYPKGKSATVEFDEPGVVPIFCEIHYSMRAYIHVVDTPYYAVTDEQKRFEIADVLPGEYVLHVWQENLPEIQRTITVGAQPLELEIP